MKKININELIFTLIIFFPISTIVQGINIFNGINKILTGVLILLLLLRNIKAKISIKNIIVLFFSLVVYICSFMYTTKELDNFNDIFYLALWILLSLWVRDNYDDFKYYVKIKSRLMYNVVIIWNFIVFISLFFSTSYNLKWGNEFYFKSFSNGEHRFAASCVFIFSLNWIVAQEKGKYKYLVFSILPIISIFLCGARTYLGVIFVFVICIYYLVCKKKSTFYITIIPVIALGIFLVMLTPMGEKFISTFNNEEFDLLASFTNGRSIFWKADIDAFFDLNFIQQFIGNGYNFIYDVNEKAINDRIWGHNDFINVLLTYGYIGVYIYMYTFFSMSNCILKSVKVSKIIIYGYYFIWLFNAMFNMVYTYICATLALPYILYSLIDYEKTKCNSNGKGDINETNNINSNI